MRLALLLPVATLGLYLLGRPMRRSKGMPEHEVMTGDQAAVGGLPADMLPLLQALAAVIVPSDGNGPGATEANVASELVAKLTDHAERRQRYLAGLRAFDRFAFDRFDGGFSSLPVERQVELIAGIESARERIFADAGSLHERLRRKLALWYYTRWHSLLPLIEFWPIVRTDVLTTYYSSQIVWDGLGYDGPPFPLGYYR